MKLIPNALRMFCLARRKGCPSQCRRRGRVCCVVLCDGQPVAHTPEGDEGHPEDETAGAKVTGGAVTWEQAGGVRRAAARARVVRHKELWEEPVQRELPGGCHRGGAVEPAGAAQSDGKERTKAVEEAAAPLLADMRRQRRRS